MCIDVWGHISTSHTDLPGFIFWRISFWVDRKCRCVSVVMLFWAEFPKLQWGLFPFPIINDVVHFYKSSIVRLDYRLLKTTCVLSHTWRCISSSYTRGCDLWTCGYTLIRGELSLSLNYNFLLESVSHGFLLFLFGKVAYKWHLRTGMLTLPHQRRNHITFLNWQYAQSPVDGSFRWFVLTDDPEGPKIDIHWLCWNNWL